MAAGTVSRGDGDAHITEGPHVQREAQIHRQRLRLHRLQRLRR